MDEHVKGELKLLGQMMGALLITTGVAFFALALEGHFPGLYYFLTFFGLAIILGTAFGKKLWVLSFSFAASSTVFAVALSWSTLFGSH